VTRGGRELSAQEVGSRKARTLLALLAINLNPVGRVYYNFSTFLCVPNAKSQSGGYALGAQAGPAPIRQLATDAGFTRFRKAAETPFNAVYEIRP
jgi:hypothetical protein